MNVILDTNILHENFYLNSPKFIGLFDYLKKTKSKLIIPNFVFREVLKLYKEELVKYAVSEDRSKRVLFNVTDRVDIETAEANYNRFWLELTREKKITLLKSKEFSTNKIFNRALDSIPPFDGAGRGLRDTLIWLNVLSIVNENPTDHVCFISNNSKDFGKSELRSELKDDLGKNVKSLLFFNSLEEFLANYGDQISFIDKKFLEEYFWDKDKLVLSWVNEDKFNSRNIEDVPPSIYIESIENMTVNSLEVQEYYIYSSTEDNYKVQLEILLNVDLLLNVASGNRDDVSYGTIYGNSICFIDLSLIIGKKDHKIALDIENPPAVYYT